MNDLKIEMAKEKRIDNKDTLIFNTVVDDDKDILIFNGLGLPHSHILVVDDIEFITQVNFLSPGVSTPVRSSGSLFRVQKEL